MLWAQYRELDPDDTETALDLIDRLDREEIALASKDGDKGPKKRDDGGET